MKQFFLIFLALIVFSSEVHSESPDIEKLSALSQHYFEPLEPVKNQADSKVMLGRTLFYEPRLSKTQAYSSNGCHNLHKYGTNGDYFLQEKADGKAEHDVPSLYNKVD